MNSGGNMTVVGALGSSLLDFSCYQAASQGRNMARPYTWPIVVLSDQEHENERRFEPPPLIHCVGAIVCSSPEQP